MESIVLHSDVARLVLGYLVNQDLKKAAHTLCRTCGRNTLPSSGACRRTTFSMAAWRTSYASTSRSLDLWPRLCRSCRWNCAISCNSSRYPSASSC
uniref:Uncharacterized protein, isoform B n=1 Tax=Drosophila pseudoobscura pseudoobscura TaxID=46245 RepID=A0A0R3NWB0_DROPS